MQRIINKKKHFGGKIGRYNQKRLIFLCQLSKKEIYKRWRRVISPVPLMLLLIADTFSFNGPKLLLIRTYKEETVIMMSPYIQCSSTDFCRLFMPCWSLLVRQTKTFIFAIANWLMKKLGHREIAKLDSTSQLVSSGWRHKPKAQICHLMGS